MIFLWRGDETEDVGATQQNITSHLENLGLQIPSEKVQKPSQEVKCLGIWWKGGMTCIPPDTLASLEQIKMPESKKDLQHVLGLLVFWRKHIPDFSVIARPLYYLLRKGVKWEWTASQEEAVQLLIFEATAHQALGPIHPSRWSGGLLYQDCQCTYGSGALRVQPGLWDFTPVALGMLRKDTLFGRKVCLRLAWLSQK